MIIKHHYTHLWTKCTIALGLFYDTGNYVDDKSEVWKFQIDPNSADAPAEGWRCYSMIMEVLNFNNNGKTIKNTNDGIVITIVL